MRTPNQITATEILIALVLIFIGYCLGMWLINTVPTWI